MEETTRLELAEDTTIGEALKALPSGIQELAKRKELSIMLNGAEVSTKEGLSTRLKGGDLIVLLPFAHGGRS
jgi:molybdopterin converting factor small subunit